MRSLRGLSRGGRLLLAVAVGGGVFGIATAVQASIPDANGVIHSCYNTSLAHGNPIGQLRVIDTAKPNGSCASWEAPLNWNANGVTGTTGPTGATGPTGPTGPSDGWDGLVTGTVPAFPDTVTLTGGVTGIPPGDYLVSGQIDAGRLGAGAAEIQCHLQFTGSGADEVADFFVSGTSGGSAPMTGHMTLTQTSSLTAVCGEQVGQTPDILVTGHVAAIRVGTLHTS